MNLTLKILKNFYAICRFDTDSPLPEWLSKSDFYSLTRTRDELSVVCNQAVIDPDNQFLMDKDWRCIKINNLLDLSLIGIIADIADTLKEKKIPIFTISTYDTDYILVKNKQLDLAFKSLKSKGYKIIFES